MVAVTVAVSLTVVDAVAELIVNEFVSNIACAVGVDSKPKPKAAITPSDKRLKNVFLDIYFLSIVVIETFPITAGKDEVFAS
jgi:hypothetical protein